MVLVLIYKQMFFDSSRCLKPHQTSYYLNKEDFDDLIEDNVCDLQDELVSREMRIELVMVDDGSRPYQMAVRNSELKKELLERRTEIEQYWGEKIRLFSLPNKKYEMDKKMTLATRTRSSCLCVCVEEWLEEIKKFQNHLLEKETREITVEVTDELYEEAIKLFHEYEDYEDYEKDYEDCEDYRKDNILKNHLKK